MEKETKTIKVSDDVWSNLYNLKLATKQKTLNDVLVKLLHKELYSEIKMEKIEDIKQ